MLSVLLTVVAGFTRDAPLQHAARRMLVQAFPATVDELALLVVWRSSDQLVYYGVVPLLAASVSAAIYGARSARTSAA